jgi:hypothetical protein
MPVLRKQRDTRRIQGRVIEEWCENATPQCCSEDGSPGPGPIESCGIPDFDFPDQFQVTMSAFADGYLCSYPVSAGDTGFMWSFCFYSTLLGGSGDDTGENNIGGVGTQGLLGNCSGFNNGSYRVKRVDSTNYVLAESGNPLGAYPAYTRGCYHDAPLPYFDGTGAFQFSNLPTGFGGTECGGGLAVLATKDNLVPWPSTFPEQVLLASARCPFQPDCDFDLVSGPAFCSFFGSIPVQITAAWYQKLIDQWFANVHMTPGIVCEEIPYGTRIAHGCDVTPPSPPILERAPMAMRTEAYIQLVCTIGCPEVVDGVMRVPITIDGSTWLNARKTYVTADCPPQTVVDHQDLMLAGTGTTSPATDGWTVYAYRDPITRKWRGGGDIVDSGTSAVVGHIDITT